MSQDTSDQDAKTLEKRYQKLEAELRDARTELETMRQDVAQYATEVARRQQAEQLAQTSESRLRRLVDASPLGLHLYRLDETDTLIFRDTKISLSRCRGLLPLTLMYSPPSVIIIF